MENNSVVKNPDENKVSDFASGTKFSTRKDFFSYKGIGKNRGTKYEILFSYLVSKLNTNPARIEINFRNLFKYDDSDEGKNPFAIRESVRNSKYASPKFLGEVIRILKLRGKYEISDEEIRETNKDGTRGGRTSGLFKFNLIKVVKKN